VLAVCPANSLILYIHYPFIWDIDKTLNEAAADKIRKYRADYNNNPPNAISFMPAIASTSGRLHSEFIRLLFLQTHRETDMSVPCQTPSPIVKDAFLTELVIRDQCKEVLFLSCTPQLIERLWLGMSLYCRGSDF
jgi:hypothetical protein